ncbi:MAG: hypothetical protein HYR90_02275 [Candidatus Andersenbacteria bacterium]|nr:hypothetical protein [Candidatus Andersenbacteria bacterium]MBI3250985.1 hypothetical protein [Candidatus Andersenbacteria bacterium]
MIRSWFGRSGRQFRIDHSLTIAQVRQHMAEKGSEVTPDELEYFEKDIGSLSPEQKEHYADAVGETVESLRERAKQLEKRGRQLGEK